MGEKHNDFGDFGRHFPCATSAKILAAMYARVPQAMAQFVLKIEKLSHIMAPTPILEMACAYGLHQGGKRPGGETGSPLLVQCVMRRRTGTSAPSALPVQLMAAKNLLSINRK